MDSFINLPVVSQCSPPTLASPLPLLGGKSPCTLSSPRGIYFPRPKCIEAIKGNDKIARFPYGAENLGDFVTRSTEPCERSLSGTLFIYYSIALITRKFLTPCRCLASVRPLSLSLFAQFIAIRNTFDKVPKQGFGFLNLLIIEDPLRYYIAIFLEVRKPRGPFLFVGEVKPGNFDILWWLPRFEVSGWCLFHLIFRRSCSIINVDLKRRPILLRHLRKLVRL
mmetsp:Transcript_28148/g.38885  ORF Transcript_28148/g.38885 Transcript_28148/m.38885 type:complete len:223 (-) Transcript_28148:52-720(-)